jgi:hypothetical protein
MRNISVIISTTCTLHVCVSSFNSSKSSTGTICFSSLSKINGHVQHRASRIRSKFDLER